MTDLLAACRSDEAGATAIEYALIAGFVALAIVAGASAVGVSLDDVFVSVSEGFP